MRVALFSRYPKSFDKPKGGVEAVTVVLARALARLDDLEVHVITLEKGLDSVVEERDGQLRIHRLMGSGWPQIADILAGPGRKRLLRCLDELKPDIVHAHETYGLRMGKVPYPFIFTVHGFDHANLIAEAAKHARLRSVLWQQVESHGLARQRHVISISPYVRTMIEKLTDAAVHDIDNPVDERFFQVERRREPCRVLCVGWINERKNTLGSVRAFAEAVAGGRQGKLSVAGEHRDQQYMDKILSCIAGHKIGDRVEFLGHIDHERLKEELSRASVFLLPSLQENAPMAIGEAMAVGVPCIVSNRCGMPFMVKEGESGFLIEPEDTQSIAARLGQLLGDDRLVERMGTASRRIAEERWHPDVIARKTREVYEKIIRTWA